MIGLFSIPKIMAYFAAFYAVMVFFILSSSNIKTSIPAILKYTAFFEILILAIFLFVWKYIWKIFPKLNDWLFPDLNGTWDVNIKWNRIKDDGTEENGEVDGGQIFIKQSFLNVSMELFTDNSESETLVVQPKKNSESGRLQLFYIYRNESKYNGSQIGTAILKISPHTNLILQGNYFTDKNTQGTFIFTRQNDNTE